MADTKRKVQEALAEKRRLLQNIKDSKKSQAAAASTETSAAVSLYQSPDVTMILIKFIHAYTLINHNTGHISHIFSL